MQPLFLNFYNNSWWKFVFWESFSSKNYKWWQLVTVSVTTNIMVYGCLSAPVILTWTDLSPTCSKVDYGALDHNGAWSEIPI